MKNSSYQASYEYVPRQRFVIPRIRQETTAGEGGKKGEQETKGGTVKGACSRLDTPQKSMMPHFLAWVAVRLGCRYKVHSFAQLQLEPGCLSFSQFGSQDSRPACGDRLRSVAPWSDPLLLPGPVLLPRGFSQNVNQTYQNTMKTRTASGVIHQSLHILLEAICNAWAITLNRSSALVSGTPFGLQTW